jgi:hypothetical protein
LAFFLLVYDQAAGKVTRLTEYSDADQDAGLQARFDLELQHRLEPNIEVVLLGARDEETLRETHGRYFKTVGELIANG